MAVIINDRLIFSVLMEKLFSDTRTKKEMLGNYRRNSKTMGKFIGYFL
jgi:hypothetical protein